MKRFFLLAGICLFGLYGCAGMGDEKVHVMVDHADEALPQNLQAVVNDSDVVVQGTFHAMKEKINLVRNGSDPTIPADELYTEGHVYDFKPVKTYKGEVPTNIQVAISYGSDIQVVDEKGQNIGKVFVESLEYLEPDEDRAYILFLNKSQIAENLYTRSGVLYQIEIYDGEDVHFISKRMVGALSEGGKTEDGEHAEFTTQYRGKFDADIIQERKIVKNYLKDEEIISLQDLEKWFES